MSAKKKPEQAEAPAEEQTQPVTPENQDVTPPAETLPEAAPLSAETWTTDEITALQDNWTERKELRELSVTLTETELAERGSELVTTLDEENRLEAEAKAFADKTKGELKYLEQRITKLKTSIRGKAELREGIECRWYYNVAGAQNGVPKIDPDMMTLVRMDTGAVVDIRRIPDSDRQMPLPLEEEAPPTTEPSEAYKAGAAAHGEGVPRHKCTHGPGTQEAQDWKQGWDEESDRIELESAA